MQNVRNTEDYKTAEYKKKAKEKFQNRFDYSKTVFINNKSKLIITCAIHGDFEIVARNHLRGNGGCEKCCNRSEKIKDTADFISRGIEKFENRFDYSKTIYKNKKTKLTITCLRHGDFEIIPRGHLKLNGGCRKCCNLKSQEKFIEDSKKVHGNFFDYSLVDYINNKTKIKLICPIHGVFEQRPDINLRGNGCDKCGGTYDLTTEDVIEKSKKIHGDWYDYSQTEYKHAKIKIKIICRIHGIFEQTAQDHYLSGCGCPTCGGKNKSQETFLSGATAVHGDLYDYSLTEYKGSHKFVKIICKIHGIFHQKAGLHLKGYGCRKCANKDITTDEYIIRAKKVHGEKFNYSLVDYQGTHKKIKIICPKHGIFEQSPHDHLRGSGCKKCNQ